MIALTVPELTALTLALAVTVVAAVFVDVACAWRQDKEYRHLRAALELQQEQQDRIDDDLDALWAWAWSWTNQLATDDQPEPEPALEPWVSAASGEEPATVIAHPAASSARKQDLLTRVATSGQHRAGGRASLPSNDDSASPAHALRRTNP